MKLEQPIIKGSCVALVTPFCDGAVDYPALGDLIERQIANGTEGILLCGTTGEGSTLTEGEKMAIFRFGADRIAGRVPMLAGTGSNDTAAAVRLSRYAAGIGANAILAITPYYNKTSQAGLVAHFTAIADAVNIPVILYHVPSRTGMQVDTSTLVSLSHHPRIAAIKEASGNLSAVTALLAACGDTLDVYAGNDDLIVPILAIGGQGVISVAANIMPQTVGDICRQFFAGRIRESTALQMRLLPMLGCLSSEVNPIPVKEALYQMELIRREYRLPLYPMDPTGANRIRTQLKQYQLLEQSNIS